MPRATRPSFCAIVYVDAVVWCACVERGRVGLLIQRPEDGPPLDVTLCMPRPCPLPRPSTCASWSCVNKLTERIRVPSHVSFPCVFPPDNVGCVVHPSHSQHILLRFGMRSFVVIGSLA